MSRRKREEGERYDADQEDYVAGRLDHQKKMALDAKKVRSFIIANPGCNEKDIREKSGADNAKAAITWLLNRKLVSYGTYGLEAVPL